MKTRRSWFPPSGRLSRRGVTMLELMIVVAIVGIASAVTIPAIATRSRPFDVAHQARQIQTEVAKLRSRAVAEQREFELVLTEGQSVSIRKKLDDGARTVERTQDLEGVAEATLNGNGSGTVTFYPSGRVDGVGDLEISGSQRVHRIRILASGMTRWETLEASQ